MPMSRTAEFYADPDQPRLAGLSGIQQHLGIDGSPPARLIWLLHNAAGRGMDRPDHPTLHEHEERLPNHYRLTSMPWPDTDVEEGASSPHPNPGKAPAALTVETYPRVRSLHPHIGYHTARQVTG